MREKQREMRLSFFQLLKLNPGEKKHKVLLREESALKVQIPLKRILPFVVIVLFLGSGGCEEEEKE